MPFSRFASVIGLAALGAVAVTGLAQPATAQLAPAAFKSKVKAAPINWNGRITRNGKGGFLVGNPNADSKLIEYVSYTCPHCADFEVAASGELGLGFIKPGKGSVEYRPLMRNAMDIAATLLVNCGAPSRMPGNHAMVLRGQTRWLNPARPVNTQRWEIGPFPQRMRAIANDLGLYPMFEARGYSRVELDRCLANEALAKAVAAENKVAMNELGITGTPSFILNGKTLEVHSWPELRPLLMAATR